LTGAPDTVEPVEVAPGVVIGDGGLAMLAGPCVIESRELVLEVASEMRTICAELGVAYVFKASFDKANRTAASSFRSIGIERSLEILAEVRETFDVPVVTDVHEVWQVAPVAEVVDMLQIPAFLCRQTDLLAAAGASGCVVNVKKGQFMAAADMGYAVEKAGGRRVLLTERGTSFGYNNLVVDFRSLPQLRELGYPVVFDATHSVQVPGGLGVSSGGEREYVPYLARAAAAVGVDALFVEVHEDPDSAPSDGPNMLTPASLEEVLRQVLALRSAVESSPAPASPD
jgi:2-dehydro-3-deoxyphosphooctonate aldolase (KDO 8-P synthase)